MALPSHLDSPSLPNNEAHQQIKAIWRRYPW
jgi:hypothetical protein